MVFFVYNLNSEKNSNYYIGHTNNIFERLKRHNAGKNKSTKPGIPWKLMYKKSFSTRSEAIKYEQYLKSLKSRKALEKIINDAG